MHRSLSVLRILSLLYLSGCASQGPPHAPSLHLPDLAKGLSAERLGDAVRLSWTSPLNTTDGDRIKGPITAVVCRELPTTGGCTPVQKLVVVSGSSTATDALPPDLCSGPPRLLLYRVELQSAAGRSAGPSDPGFAAAGPAPPPVGPLQLSARRNAVLVRWSPAATPASAVMELRRTLAAASAGGPGKPAAAAPSKRGGALRGPSSPIGETILHGPAQDGSAAPDGLLDPTVADANTYTYVGQRVVYVTVSGHTLELRGLRSPPANFTFHDIFPPQAPAGLVAVPGGGFGAPLSVDLSWEPNVETDLVGYNVYRRTGQGEFRRIHADPVPSPAYRDLKVDAGQTYTYRITAVDQRGNESLPGAQVDETPRP